MWKKRRILFLLFILLLVAGKAFLVQNRIRDWDKPVWVAIHAINADNSTAASKTINRLKSEDFNDIEAFFSREAGKYPNIHTQAFKIILGSEIKEMPPLPPKPQSLMSTVLWSLEFRYWASKYDDEIPAQIQIFVLYYDPDQQQTLDHSLGLKEGMIGMVHAFASQRQKTQNNIIIAHEILHTVRATDKYDLKGQPINPIGLANPNQQPLFPQTKAELMGGRIAISPYSAEMPKSLKDCVIGEYTAKEIAWIP